MAGVDIAGQFPNSRMARAVKLGQSRMVSADTPSSVQTPGQENVSIAVATALTLPPANAANNFRPTTYAIVTAIGGTMYVTYDGSVPSVANYEIAVATGSSLPVQGAATLAAIRVQGTTMSASYWA